MQLKNRDVSEFLEKDGSLIVKIKKALYGLVESARLWYDHLCATLLSIGYKVSQFDRGLIHKDTDTGKSLICLHVDDVLQSTNSTALNEESIFVLPIRISMSSKVTRSFVSDHNSMSTLASTASVSVSLGTSPIYSRSFLWTEFLSHLQRIPCSTHLAMDSRKPQPHTRLS